MVLRYLTNLSHQLRTALLIALFLVAGPLMFPQSSEAVPEGIPCTPEPTDMAVNYGDLVTCQITPSGDADLFRFSGAVGETVDIVVSQQNGGSPCVELFDPTGSLVAQHCQAGFAEIRPTLTKAGTHTIRVSEYFNDQPLTYTLSLERIAPPSPSAMPLSFDQFHNDEINPAGDADLYKFEGAVGETVDIVVSQQSGGSPCVELFDPTGSLVAQRCQAGFAEIRPTLTKAGTHTIRVSEYFNDQPLTYGIVMQCLVAPCASSLFPTIATTLTGCTTCSPSNTFSANAAISNPTARWLEIKAGVYLPDRTPVNLLGDKHIELPPGFTFNGTVFSTTIPNGLPQGTYQFCGLLLERELGRSLAESCHPFTIGP